VTRVWVSTDFEGWWPVGTAAVVVGAENEAHAHSILAAALHERGLPDKPFTVTEIASPGVYVLCDGNY
jgi:hypothetical protein